MDNFQPICKDSCRTTLSDILELFFQLIRGDSVHSYVTIFERNLRKIWVQFQSLSTLAILTYNPVVKREIPR